MYRDSIEDEEGDEAVTEVVTGAVTEAMVEEDTVPTGAPVAVDEDVAINSWRFNDLVVP